MNKHNQTSLPMVVLERHTSWLLGLVYFHMTVEDRRPDLTEQQASQLLGYKYTVSINIRIAMQWWTFIYRTFALGAIVENGNDIGSPISQEINSRPQVVSDTEFEHMLAKHRMQEEQSRPCTRIRKRVC